MYKKNTFKSNIIIPATILWSFFLSSCQAQKPLTAREVIEKIKTESGIEWNEETVDTYKGGNEDIVVSGIATTFMATMEVLKKAVDAGCNLIITHEPTYYNHHDDPGLYGADSIIEKKRKFIADNNLVVFRFHDHIHRMEVDGIYAGVEEELNWTELKIHERPYIYHIPQTTLEALAEQMSEFYKTETVRVVGNPDQLINRAALVLGAPGPQAQITTLKMEDVDVLIGGEAHEWETVEWVRDAVELGKGKGLILIGHALSEEGGMRYCAKWMKQFMNKMPIHFIPAGNPFWSPLKH